MIMRCLGRRIWICSRQPPHTNPANSVHTNAVNLKFVPPSNQPIEEDILKLTEFVSQAHRLLVLTGAGISTESGIPDYRSEGVGLYARSSSRPVIYQDFLKSDKVKQKYWARNYIGWPKFSSFLPNDVHQTISEWEQLGIVHWIVTQNVDALHLKAGSRKVTELHGSSHGVECLTCSHCIPRTDYQKQLEYLNHGFTADSLTVNPDGDVELSNEQVDKFKVAPCTQCGGHMKPQIVFFGDNVKKPIVEFLYEKVESCDRVLVAGSSLEVFSGYRFVNRAKEYGKPIAIVNIGPTRGDRLASLKVNARCGHIMPHIQLPRL